jgi:hypothetical protein
MSESLVLENRGPTATHQDEQSESKAAEQGTSAQYDLTIEENFIAQQFSKTRKIVYCATIVSLGIIAIVTMITVALIKSHSKKSVSY